MIRNNKKKLIISSLLILLPILVGLILWDQFPEKMTTHWGLDGQADGWSSVPFAVFVPPLLILAGHLLCIWVTDKDPGNKGRNRKPLGMVFWIFPIVSNLCSYMMYALALGLEFSPFILMMIMMGLIFIITGNYMPKTRMNSTMGIKVQWAYTSEENWNATHRFGGKVWVGGGIILLFGALLPEKIGGIVMLIAILVLSVIPIAYSYLYYRKQLARGEELRPLPKLVTSANKWTLLFIIVLLLGISILMFTGNIHVVFGEEAFTIEASWYSDLTVNYDTIESMEYREGNIHSSRVGGFGSFRLLMGFFRNDEFGTFTRYTYTNPEACVIIKSAARTLILSGIDRESTQEIFTQLMERTKDIAVAITLPES